MKEMEYDVIVVGAGHAGNEAAAAAANMGSKVLMITMNMNTIGHMSCNPAMGGVAKGQIIREIDAMGGYSGIVANRSAIQFRMLNRSKGPAMWSPRSQNDRFMFAMEWRYMLEGVQNLDFIQASVTGIVLEGDRVTGVKSATGEIYKGQSVILTSGTFLNGLIHIGEKNYGGGRAGEKAAYGVTEQLVELGFDSGRMKTGTPPRIDGRSLDYSKMEEQPGDEDPKGFSFLEPMNLKEQRHCHIAYTNADVHDKLREGFDRSPMFNGTIQSIGPRYCPSIEDKIDRFVDKDRHQLFVEPEGWRTIEIYLNGFSTSLPEEVQLEAMKLIPGFERVKMFRPGYAIEYDYFPPTQLTHTLQTKLIKNLFFAGQINGTTGYEEAGCQGLMAGINAHQVTHEKEPVILGREEAYIGVLIDDLITKGTEEPYRMFTSRAEYRIMLRQDNADIRLTELSHKLGLAEDERLRKVERKLEATEKLSKSLDKTSVHPDEVNGYLERIGSSKLKQQVKASSIVGRPQVNLYELINESSTLKDVKGGLGDMAEEAIVQAEIRLKYQGYIDREKETAEKMRRLEGLKIPVTFDFHSIPALSMEARQKLSTIKPATIGQASRISGVSPADISSILVKLGR